MVLAYIILYLKIYLDVEATELFYVIHYGKISDKYTSGEKDEFYALIESKDGKGTYEERLKHHMYVELNWSEWNRIC